MHIRRFNTITRLICCCVLSLLCGSASFGAAPMAGKQAPGFFRMMLGDFEITALYDGSTEFDAQLMRNTTPLLTQRLWERSFVFSRKAPGCINAFLVNTGEHLILVDAGAGKVFGPTLGFMLENLRASGYEPENIDTVLVTHLHGDHVGGLVTADGKRVFPNAVVMVSREENEYWLSSETAAKAPAGTRHFFALARQAAAPYQAAGCWKIFEAGSELFSGVKAEAAIGHTPGQSVFLVSSNDQQLLFMGDAIHNAATQFPNPSIAIMFDSDSPQAVEYRKALFARAAREKLPLAGAHLPFPGIGRLRAEGIGYTWVPVAYGPVK